MTDERTRTLELPVEEALLDALATEARTLGFDDREAYVRWLLGRRDEVVENADREGTREVVEGLTPTESEFVEEYVEGHDAPGGEYTDEYARAEGWSSPLDARVSALEKRVKALEARRDRPSDPSDGEANQGE
ncbi:hypothetical protein [Halomarina ordinaria]|uniref:Ribbon-helix-helix protein, CopG family n=1 Tax=Halomarina ordinaria TaxID=3033939 RepID=A0ABD5UH61_9EURY|nr:hypothetical protein [Halomarina sp. PSRA2]